MQSKASQPIQRTDGISRETERRIITGVPTSSWYALQEKGLAPKPVRLGPRSVGWPRQELFAWCEQRLVERDAKVAQSCARVAGAAPTPADIVAMFDAVTDHAAFVRAGAALSAIPSAMLTDADRGDIARAMIGAQARCWVQRSKDAGLSD